jgi:hypothetical protein
VDTIPVRICSDEHQKNSIEEDQTRKPVSSGIHTRILESPRDFISGNKLISHVVRLIVRFCAIRIENQCFDSYER